MKSSKDLNLILNFKNLLIFIILVFFISGCQLNPATGDNELILMSESEEKAIGDSEHLKIIEQFGGVYDNKKLQNYINTLGFFLVNTTELPELKFTFTLLNTDIVNAFALPGGYVYITRGLLSICQNEAQLAGVIAHEIGHITAKHTAKRYTKNVGTNLFVNILNTLSNNLALGNLINQTAGLYLLSYSREQEYQADTLAVRYMARAGFKTDEMANFFQIMKNHSEMVRKIQNIPNRKNPSDLLSTHPSSTKRIKEVIDKSRDKNIARPIVGREIFLKKIDGMLYGDDPKNGILFKNKFYHQELGIYFEFPREFFFINKPRYIQGKNSVGSKIFFDVDSKNLGIKDYLKNWKNRDLVENTNISVVNKLQLITGVIKKKNQIIQIAFFKNNNKFYRFFLYSKSENFKDDSKIFKKIVNSFKIKDTLKNREKKYNYIKVVTPTKKDTFEKILSNQSLQDLYAKETFEIINNIQNEEIIPGKKIKIIVSN